MVSRPEVHYDSPARLQRGVAEHVRRSRRESPLRSTLLLAPTRRLLDHLARVLPNEVGALAGLHLRHHRSLAGSLLEEAGEEVPAEVPFPWLVRAFRRRLVPGRSSFEAYLAEHVSALASLLGTFRDLRDAGLLTPDLPRIRHLSATATRTLALFARFQEMWQHLATEGFGDAALLADRATRTLATQAPIYAEVHHYGAYDLTGVQRRLVEALAHQAPLDLWIPGAVEAADSPLPRHLAERLGGAWPELPEAEPRCRVQTTACAEVRAELQRAFRRLFHWHEQDGIPFREMAILVRSPGPIAIALATEQRRLKVPVDSSLALPLRDQGEAMGFRGVLQWLQDPEDGRARARLRLPPRAAEWSEARLERFLRHDRRARTLPDRLQGLLELAREIAPRWVAPHLESMATSIERLEPHLGRDAIRELPELLLADLERQHVPANRADGDSPLAVLDLLQARGIPWRRAVLIQANEGTLPRVPREDAFLPDADRRRLAQATGQEVPIKGDAREEEQYLFALARASVQEQLDVSYSRTDYRGRPLSPSPFLAELEAESGQRARHVPPHPLDELEQGFEEAPLLSPQEALVWTGLQSADAAEEVRALARQLDVDLGTMERGLTMLQTTESWRPGAGDFDGRFGAPDEARPWSARSLQMLARCPLQYGFQYRLRLRVEPPVEEESEYSALEMGILVHEVLEHLYRELADADPEHRRALARSRLPELWQQAESAAVERSLPDPVRSVRAEVWQDAILRFVDQDLARIEGRQATIHECERIVETTVDLGEGISLPLHARIDRILRRPDGAEELGDYKTGSPALLSERIKETAQVRGLEPQLPLYWLSRAAEDHEVYAAEYVAVGPRALAAGPDATYVRLPADTMARLLPRVMETWRTLVSLARGGRFPMNSASSPDSRGEGPCGRCDYRRLCRHTHQPSIHRDEADPRAAEYFQRARQMARGGRGS